MTLESFEADKKRKRESQRESANEGKSQQEGQGGPQIMAPKEQDGARDAGADGGKGGNEAVTGSAGAGGALTGGGDGRGCEDDEEPFYLEKLIARRRKADGADNSKV